MAPVGRSPLRRLARTSRDRVLLHMPKGETGRRGGRCGGPFSHIGGVDEPLLLLLAYRQRANVPAWAARRPMHTLQNLMSRRGQVR